MARVQLVGVSKRFGQTTAVTDLNLDIVEGEFLTLLGGSGCGKSTTLNLIAGLEFPSTGRVLFDDEDVTSLTRTQCRGGLPNLCALPS
jgi:ABC-type sugar transport system ATPase subunit